jgi:hypothetical protein
LLHFVVSGAELVEMTIIDKAIALVRLLASLPQRCCGLGSLIEVPDNINTIVGELQRIGRMNALAAFAALVAALCAAHAFWRQLF